MAATTPSGIPATLASHGAVARRQAISRASRWALLFATLIGIVVLVILGIDVIRDGADRLSIEFLTEQYSRKAEQAGMRAAIIGTVWLLVTTIMIAVPIAIGTAIFMEEFAPRTGFAGKVTQLIRLNIQNLAGVPSIIYGILGLALFVRFLGLGPSILAGGLTVALMIVPMTIIASSEAISQVPPSIRDGSLALGATRLQTVWFHTLPNAMPGIMTGLILSVARAIGETAAVIMIGAAAYVTFDPEGINDRFTIVPIQIYNWTTAPQTAFRENAAAAIIVLMVAVVGLNLVAAVIRQRFTRKS